MEPMGSTPYSFPRVRRIHKLSASIDVSKRHKESQESLRARIRGTLFDMITKQFLNYRESWKGPKNELGLLGVEEAYRDNDLVHEGYDFYQKLNPRGGTVTYMMVASIVKIEEE